MEIIKYCCLFVVIIFFKGCATGHTDFIKDMDNEIGYKVPLNIKPHKNENAGEVYRGRHIRVGKGLTHITRDKNNNIVIHYSHNEVLPGHWRAGECLTYRVVDSKTGIILAWGFDEGNSPNLCVAWWP